MSRYLNSGLELPQQASSGDTLFTLLPKQRKGAHEHDGPGKVSPIPSKCYYSYFISMFTCVGHLALSS